MSLLLVESKNIVDKAKANGLIYLEDKIVDTIHRAYDAVVKDGFAINPAPVKIPGKRGKPKATCMAKQKFGIMIYMQTKSQSTQINCQM